MEKVGQVSKPFVYPYCHAVRRPFLKCSLLTKITMKKYLAGLLLAGFIQTAQAASTFDPNTNILTIDSIVTNGVQYNNVIVLMNSYNVLSIGSSAPIAPATCNANSLTTYTFNRVGLGMSLDAINNIVGCKYDPVLTFRMPTAIMYTWTYVDPNIGLNLSMNVFFDLYGTRSIDIGGGVFKAAHGY